MLESFVTLVILAPLLLPVALQLKVDPLQYGIVMTEAFAIGVILPPIGIALYVACAITGAQVEKASRSLLWYLPVMLGGLVVVAGVGWKQFARSFAGLQASPNIVTSASARYLS